MKETIEVTLANAALCCEKENPKAVIVAVLLKEGVVTFHSCDMSSEMRMVLAGNVFGAAIFDQQKERLDTLSVAPLKQKVQ